MRITDDLLTALAVIAVLAVAGIAIFCTCESAVPRAFELASAAAFERAALLDRQVSEVQYSPASALQIEHCYMELDACERAVDEGNECPCDIRGSRYSAVLDDLQDCAKSVHED